MTSIRWVLVVWSVMSACGDDGVRRLPDAPTIPDAPVAIDAPDDPALTIMRSGNGTGTVTSLPAGIACGATCSATFAPATVVTLTAEPGAGSVFGGWGGACSGQSAVCEVTVSAASSVTATFTLRTYTVTVSRNGVGTGTVTGNGINCGGTCTATVDHGTVISLAAAPGAKSTFAGWGGPCSGTGTCTATIIADTTITAAFSLDDITLLVAKDGTGAGTVTSAPAGISCGLDCSETYVANTMVTLTGTATAGSTFIGWSGGGCIGTAPCTLTMTAAVVVTATFALNTYALTVTTGGNGTGSVTSTPAGIACGSDCTETYNHGQVVTLNATPGAGSTLTWSGACSGSGACVVTMDAAKSVTATFTLSAYNLAVNLGGNGAGTVTSSPAGITCQGDCSESFNHGQVVTLIAAAQPGSVFTSWSGACGGTGACVVTMDAIKSVTATFTLNTYALTVTTGGNASGSVTATPAGVVCPGDCTETYNHGQVITLTAAPAAGATVTWSGACSGSGACAVTMDAIKSVTATFTLNTYALTVTHSGNGVGTVTSNPAGINCVGDCTEIYNHGQVVSLTAAPQSGTQFMTWGGACTGSGACNVTMDAAKNVTATFVLNTYLLTVNTAGNGSGTVMSSPAGISCAGDCTETYNHGQIVTLTATPATGSTLMWTGACTGSGACVVTMDAAKSVTATFTLDTFTLTAAASGPGTVTSTPSGINCGTDCTEIYNYNQVVTLTPTPTGTALFTGWSGDCSGTGACSVTMTAAHSVTATFAPTFLLTVTLPGTNTGAGTVASVPAGIACGSDCTQAYASGTSVVLTATPSLYSAFAGWSGAGCTGTGTCTVSMTVARTVTAVFSAPNMMFVTSSIHTGSLGGLTGADATCRSLAMSAGLLGSAPGQNDTWRAWLSSSAAPPALTSAAARMGTAAGWIRTDGKPVFATVGDIAADRIIYPPRLTQSGTDVGAGQRVWTGTGANGLYSGSQCTGGSAAVVPWGGTMGTGTTGYASGNSSLFTSYSTQTCTVSARLYCMGIDRASPLPATTPETGRFAFTSTAPYTPNSGGLGTADAICDAEAMAAGLPGPFPGAYRALLSTTGATAISRFSTGAGTQPWIRTGDRIRIAPTAAGLGTASVLTVAPNVSANGLTRLGNVRMWTGATSPGAIGDLGVTCNDWTAAGKGTAGRAGDTGVSEVWFNAPPSGPSCTDPDHRVICLQR